MGVRQAVSILANGKTQLMLQIWKTRPVAMATAQGLKFLVSFILKSNLKYTGKGRPTK